MADVALTIRVEGAQEAQQAIDKINGLLGRQGDTAEDTSKKQKKLNTEMGNMVGVGGNLIKSVITPLISFVTGATIIKAANDFQLLENRLKLVTDGAVDLEQTQARLLGISQQTGTSFAANIEVFTRFAQNAQTINATGDEIAQLTENITKLIVVSGAEAETAKAALIQLSQGFASGQLRGEELRSVMEQLPAVAREIEKQLGLTTGEFRELSFAGKLSAEEVKVALLAATSEIQEKFDEMGDTAGQAFQRLQNASFDLIGSLNEATGFTAALADILNSTAEQVGVWTEVVDRFKDVDQITFSSFASGLEVAVAKVGQFLLTGIGLNDFFDRLAVDIDRLASGVEALGFEGFAESIRNFADSVRGLSSDLEDQSLTDALIPPDAAEVASQRLDAAFQARLVALANERKAEEELVEIRARLEAEKVKLAEEARKKEEAAEAKKIATANKLEEDRLSFLVSVNEMALEDLREFWRLRLEEAKNGTREELEALEELARVNEQIAQREIDAIQNNTGLSRQEQQERLAAVRESLAEQAAAVENGAARFGLALAAVDEALADNQKEIDKTKTAVEELADRFNDGFTTIPGAVFSAATSIRSAFQGLFVDVFTQSKSLGDAVLDFFGNVADAILTNLANVIADQAFKTLFGSFGGSGGDSGSGLLGFVGDLFGLAHGGARVVTGRTPIMVGERGPELVSRSPLGSGGFRAMATGGSAIVTRPSVFLGGERGPERVSVRPLAAGVGGRSFRALSSIRGPSMRSFATGGSTVLSSPTLIMAGERGPERATFTPLAAGSRGMGGVRLQMNAPSFFGGNLGSSQLERQLAVALQDRMDRRRTR